MFLSLTRRRNHRLIQAAASLHQQRVIPANTFVLDEDALVANAELLADAAAARGLSLYFMTKQLNRNPAVAAALVRAGLEQAVAVDSAEARVLHRAGIRLGHVGHLVQVPQAELPEVLSWRPEVMTVFSVEKAEQVSAAAVECGLVQDVLLRVVGPDDFHYPGQEGGIEEADLPAAAAAIARLPGVRIAGVTSFPCVLFDDDQQRPVPTANMATVTRAAATLRQLGYDISQVNAPSLTAVGTLDLLKAAGATHGEPGHSLTGTTPWHAVSDQPEAPALVYVTEVSHVYRGHAYVFGGGFYPRGVVSGAVVGSNPDALDNVYAAADPPPGYNIDYYGALALPERHRVAVGDTAVYAFRAQAFTSRANLAVVSGLAEGGPVHVSVFDARNEPLSLAPVAVRL